MLVAASIFTTQKDQIVQRWKLEGGVPRVPGQKVDTPTVNGDPGMLPDIPLTWRKEDFILLPDGAIAPVTTNSAPYTGMMVVYDWDSKDVIWKSDWGNRLLTPAGYCFADGVIYLNDLEGASIFVVDLEHEPGRLLKRFSHPYLNDLHSLVRTGRGVLVTCSGNDAIFELDLNGNLLWEWWATEHGYSISPSGKERTSGRGQEHRDQYYHTRYHATHVNTATMRDESERYVLSLLFHQGQLIQIDRSLPEAEQHAEVLLEGLARPHTLEKFNGGWLCCNSLAKELLVLDDNLKIAAHIPYDGGWIQDCTRLSNGHILVNDVDMSRVVEFAGSAPFEMIGITPYDANWRMAELVEVPKHHEASFSGANHALARAS
ncbi:MAG: hypothetical protein WB762_19215 [Candidatus Sulfotelmatobacter sp.]